MVEIGSVDPNSVATLVTMVEQAQALAQVSLPLMLRLPLRQTFLPPRVLVMLPVEMVMTMVERLVEIL